MQLKSKDYNLKPCAHQDALQEMRERIRNAAAEPRYQRKCLALPRLASSQANGPSRGKLILYTINFLIARRNDLSKSSFRVLM